MKSKAKILGILITVLVFGCAQVKGQGMPVYDNTNFITLGKQIIESAKQTAELLKTVEFLREQKERIEKVNNVIKQLKAVREIARNNERLFNTVRDDLRGILSSPYIRPEEVERVSNSFNSIIENALDDFDFISEILSSDHLKMTDGERAKVLKEREQKSKEMVSEIERRTERYKEIIAFREMQERINNRDTNF
ncbi:MAG: conjugal transfer protein [Bacteroidota bacterium]